MTTVVCSQPLQSLTSTPTLTASRSVDHAAHNKAKYTTTWSQKPSDKWMQHDSAAGAAVLYSALGRPSVSAATSQQAARGSGATAPSQQMPAAALPERPMQPHTDTAAAVPSAADATRPHHDMLSDMQKEQNKRRANRNRITWGSRSSRTVSRVQTASRPESSTDSGSGAAGSALQPQQQPQLQQERQSHEPHTQQQPHGQAGGLPQVVPGTSHASDPLGLAALLQGPKQLAQAATVQQSTGAASGAMQVPSCGAPSAADVQQGPDSQQPDAATQDTALQPEQLLCQVQVQHSEVLVQLGQLLQRLAKQREQQHISLEGKLDTEALAAEAASALPAAKASGKQVSDTKLGLQPSKVAKTSQRLMPSSAAVASMSPAPSPPPAGAMTAVGAPERGLPLLAVRPGAGLGSGNIPAALLQQLSSSPSPATAFGSSSRQQATTLQPSSSGVLGLLTAGHYTGKLPVVQLPMAMRVSYLRAAGFLPPATAKPNKRKAEKQSEDGTGKLSAPRKRSRRRFNDVDQPVVGWDARSYTHGSDRQRVWEEHLMILRVIDHVLSPDPQVAARVRQATIEYNARSCVCCWRARPVSGSWYCSRPICWDKHKAEYEGPTVTHASIAAVDEVHWGDVKDIVQPVLKQREEQLQLQQEGSSTAAAVAAGEVEATTGAGDLDAVVDVPDAGGPAAAAAEDADDTPPIGVAPDSLAASSRASPATVADVQGGSPAGDIAAAVAGSAAATPAGEQMCDTPDATVADVPGSPTPQQQEVVALDTSVEASRDNQQDMPLTSAAADPVGAAHETEAGAGSVGKAALVADVCHLSSSAADTTAADVATKAPAGPPGTASEDSAVVPAVAVAAAPTDDPAAVVVSAAPDVSAAPAGGGSSYQAPEEPVKDFVLPTREYKYPDLKRLWQEHQLNMRVLLIEVKDQPTALARLQDAIVRVFNRPCLRCLSDAGHKVGNGCWFCANCQRMWGKNNPITDREAWEAITSGVGVDPNFVRRRGPSAAQVADAAQAVRALGALQQQAALSVLQAPVSAGAGAAPAAVPGMMPVAPSTVAGLDS